MELPVGECVLKTLQRPQNAKDGVVTTPLPKGKLLEGAGGKDLSLQEEKTGLPGLSTWCSVPPSWHSISCLCFCSRPVVKWLFHIY